MEFINGIWKTQNAAASGDGITLDCADRIASVRTDSMHRYRLLTGKAEDSFSYTANLLFHNAESII
jgi:hypothetical protein